MVKKEAEVLGDNESPLELNNSLIKDCSPIISVQNISKSFHNKIVLSDISFEIKKNDIFGLIGMSGSGKSTLFQLMTGMLNVDSGDVLIKNLLINPKLSKQKINNNPDFVSVFKNQKKVKKKFGFASQRPSFYDHLSVYENIMLYASLHNIPKKTAIINCTKLLKTMELFDNKNVIASELSGGMRRRLDIACALIHDPEVLLLDEPTSELDPVMRKQIWSLIQTINKQGTTVIISSHIIEEIEHLCSKVAILHDHRVLGYGSLDELKSIFKNTQQIRVETKHGNYDSLIKILQKEKSIERFVIKNNKLIIFVPPEDKAIKRLVKIVENNTNNLLTIDISDATLSEIFEALSRKAVQ